MRALEEKILSEGKILPGGILKVDGFLNHKIDVPFVISLGKEIARLYKYSNITEILTIESSGITVACAAAQFLNVPVVFAKKNKSSNISNEFYTAGAHSFTHGNDYSAVVSKEYICSDDVVLIVDDFLALGSAANCLIDIVRQAGAEVAGIASVIEKGFQGGGDKLRESGIRVESLAIIDRMDDCQIEFRPQ